MPKDSREIVDNWLVKLLGFASGSAIARRGIISIGGGLKANCGGVSKIKQNFYLSFHFLVTVDSRICCIV
jgi:hypothetical protein